MENQNSMTLQDLLDMCRFETYEAANQILHPYGLLIRRTTEEGDAEILSLVDGETIATVEAGELYYADEDSEEELEELEETEVELSEIQTLDPAPLASLLRPTPLADILRQNQNRNSEFRASLEAVLSAAEAEAELDEDEDDHVILERIRRRQQDGLRQQELKKAANMYVDSYGDDRTVNNVMRHGYRVLGEEEKISMQTIKDIGLEFHEFLDALAPSREISIAKTKIEEAVMWAIKSVSA